MTFSRYITLSDIDIFNDYESLNLEKLLAEIPKDFLINFTSNLSNRLLYRVGSFEIDNDIFLKLFKFDGNFVNHIAKILNRIQEEDGFKKIILFTPIANLKIQQYTIVSGRENNRNIKPIDFINLFKAYLYLNEEYSIKSDKLTEFTKNKKDNEVLLTYYVTLFFYQLEFLNPAKDQFIQIFKAVLFFKYVKTSLAQEPYLKIFLKERGYDTWQDYIKNLGSIFLRQFDPKDYISYEDSKYIIHIDRNSKKEVTLLNLLNVLTADLNKFNTYDVDFKILRKYPVYKSDDEHFIFLNLKFFLDKIFNTLQFDFYEILKRDNNKLSLPLFRTLYYSQTFIEEFLLRYIVFDIFKNKFKVYKSKNTDGFECADFFLLHFNNLILIECKDIIISADIKNSQDPDLIYRYIKNKLTEDAGVPQFIRTLVKIDEGKSKQKPIDEVQSKFGKMVVFPIIVYTDRTLDCNGINVYINRIFEEELSKVSFRRLEIKKLILINIKFFN